jgi:hypothetical protein
LVTERVEAPACSALELDMAAENHLLMLLDSATRFQLKPHMRTIAVEHGEVLHGSSSDIEFAYFPQSSIVSVLARTEQGRTAETSIVGREGMIGSSSIHGIMTSFAECTVCRFQRFTVSDRPVRVFEKSLRCSICLCSRSRSNRLPVRRCIKLKAGQRGGFSSAANGWEAMTSG